jgi:hypothetical protein
MKRVSAAEFQERAAEFVDARETLSIERDGRRIGYYLPVVPGVPVTNGPVNLRRPTATPEERREAMERLRDVLARVYDETGLTEDEFADLMDPSKPFPYDDPARG